MDARGEQKNAPTWWYLRLDCGATGPNIAQWGRLHALDFGRPGQARLE